MYSGLGVPVTGIWGFWMTIDWGSGWGVMILYSKLFI